MRPPTAAAANHCGRPPPPGGVGQFACQLAKVRYGMYVVGSCSPSHAALVKSLGADKVWDHNQGVDGLKARWLSNRGAASCSRE